LRKKKKRKKKKKLRFSLKRDQKEKKKEKRKKKRWKRQGSNLVREEMGVGILEVLRLQSQGAEQEGSTLLPIQIERESILKVPGGDPCHSKTESTRH